jgi:hypothetical protein
MGIEVVFPNLPFMNIAGQLQKLYSAIKDNNSCSCNGIEVPEDSMIQGADRVVWLNKDPHED